MNPVGHLQFRLFLVVVVYCCWGFSGGTRYETPRRSGWNGAWGRPPKSPRWPGQPPAPLFQGQLAAVSQLPAPQGNRLVNASGRGLSVLGRRFVLPLQRPGNTERGLEARSHPGWGSANFTLLAGEPFVRGECCPSDVLTSHYCLSNAQGIRKRGLETGSLELSHPHLGSENGPAQILLRAPRFP